jgi:hypothetical protein
VQGCPIRVSPGQPASGYPKLFVACYALHRLQVPRHPPCALSYLTAYISLHTQPSQKNFTMTEIKAQRAVSGRTGRKPCPSHHSSLITHHSAKDPRRNFVLTSSLCSFQGAQPFQLKALRLSSSQADLNTPSQVLSSICAMFNPRLFISGKRKLYRLALTLSRFMEKLFRLSSVSRFRLCLRQGTTMGFCGDPARQEGGAPVIREGGLLKPYYQRRRLSPGSDFLQLFFSF